LGDVSLDPATFAQRIKDGRAGLLSALLFSVPIPGGRQTHNIAAKIT